MNKIDKEVAARINQELKRYFGAHGLSQQEIADRLGYSNANAVAEWLCRGHFDKRSAAKWARAFGFNETYLLTGKGQLMVRRSGYQKLVRENESLRQIVNSQRHVIETLKSKLVAAGIS